MINKNSFVKIMNGMRDYDDHMRALENNLNVMFEDNWLTSMFDVVLDALFEDVEGDLCPDDADPIMYHFAFFCDWGRKEDASIEIDGKQYPLKSAGYLYDLLVELREEQSNG